MKKTIGIVVISTLIILALYGFVSMVYEFYNRWGLVGAILGPIGVVMSYIFLNFVISKTGLDKIFKKYRRR